MEEIIEIEALIRGRVQLVMFRDFARRNADRLGRFGFVRNSPDGTVTVVAQGGKEVLEKFIELLKKGSLLSKVESVSVAWRVPQKSYKYFTIVY